MSVGFSVAGSVNQIEKMIQTARDIEEKQGCRIGVGEEGMRIVFCPMGCLDVTWSRDEERPGKWLVESDCQTSQVGAGFHKAALEMIEAFGIEDMSVDDETDYYNHRDFQRMKREHFYPWMTQLLRICEKLFSEDGSDQVCLCWDLDLYKPETVERTVVTPLGRYTLEYLKGILEQQGEEALAERWFLWKNEERDALFYRNRALYELWVECYFAPSSRSDRDREINGNILDDLERAYKIDAQLPIPYETYKEVCRLHGRIPVIDGKVEELSYEFPAGYRKSLVAEAIGSLRLMLPGSYMYEWEEDGEGGGTNLWCDDSADSPVWRVSSYQRSYGEAEFTNGLKGVRDLDEYEIPNGRMRFGWRECGKNSEKYYMVECEVITGQFLYLITVAYLKQTERKGIVELLHKMTAVPRRPTGENRT